MALWRCLLCYFWLLQRLALIDSDQQILVILVVVAPASLMEGTIPGRRLASFRRQLTAVTTACALSWPVGRVCLGLGWEEEEMGWFIIDSPCPTRG